MTKITGFEMAKIVQSEMNTKFSLVRIREIEIDSSKSDPEINITLEGKLSKSHFELKLIAEQQEENKNNVHFTLLNNDQFFLELYRQNRSQYVQRNHEVAEQIRDTELVPENLYLIQSESGLPGVDFIQLSAFVDATNLIITICDIFKNN